MAVSTAQYLERTDKLIAVLRPLAEDLAIRWRELESMDGAQLSNPELDKERDQIKEFFERLEIASNLPWESVNIRKPPLKKLVEHTVTATVTDGKEVAGGRAIWNAKKSLDDIASVLSEDNPEWTSITLVICK